MALLDRIPFGWAVVAGVLLGLLVGVTVFGWPNAGRLMAVAIVVAMAAVVAWSAQPLGIWETMEKAESLLDMVSIKGGSFLMGSPEAEPGRYDDERRHRVALSSFRMAETAVTNAQYSEVMKLDSAPGQGSDDHPVTKVSWFDAVAFCNRLSEQEGLTPCYELNGETVLWIDDAGGYRLPTEAEWEYAARARTTSRWSFGDDDAGLKNHAWYAGNSGGEYHPVGQLASNEWGLYDMHGNVWEWCWDVYAPYSRGIWSRPIQFWPIREPRGPDEDRPRASRVLRGGAFNFESRVLRSAARNWFEPENARRSIGFRCVRRLVRSQA